MNFGALEVRRRIAVSLEMYLGYPRPPGGFTRRLESHCSDDDSLDRADMVALELKSSRRTKAIRRWTSDFGI